MVSFIAAVLYLVLAKLAFCGVLLVFPFQSNRKKWSKNEFEFNKISYTVNFRLAGTSPLRTAAKSPAKVTEV